jgi:hypothetical protein
LNIPGKASYRESELEQVIMDSVLKENKRLFASKYKLYLPTEQELIGEIQREKHLIFRERRERYGL